MANTQLVDYVKGQLNAGVSREAILGALRAAGWAESDILESVKLAEGAASPSPQIQAKAVDKSPVVVQRVTPITPEPSRAKESPASIPGFSPSKMFSDVEGTKKMAMPVSLIPEEKKSPASASYKVSPASSAPSLLSILFKKEWFMPSIFTAVILALAAWLFVLYRSNADVASQLVLLKQTDQENAAKLGAQITKLTIDNAVLKSDRDTAAQNAKQAEAELGFFVVPKDTSATVPLIVDVKGTLGGTPFLYTLTTSDGVMINIKNSKDAAAAAALKPLAGMVVDIVGTHLPASRDLTAISVNGVPIQKVSPLTAATSSATTTTQ